MKDIEKIYSKLFFLLEVHSNKDQLVREILSQRDEKVNFSSFASNETRKAPKLQILNIYKKRANRESTFRSENPFVVGYDLLIPNLEKTKLDYINVSSINSDKGTYIIFSDYDYTKLIGILKSKRTLIEVQKSFEEFSYESGYSFQCGRLIE